MLRKNSPLIEEASITSHSKILKCHRCISYKIIFTLLVFTTVHTFSNLLNLGETLPCQKHFTQRLENNFQALNMLVAEYLMRMDFTYSLSVFISEVPLANMVFDFAQSLLGCKPDESCQELRFKDEDVWRILNYIGVKCDSHSATNIVNMYRKEESSLLMCILKCIDLYKYQMQNVEEMNDLRVGAPSSSSLSEDNQKSSTIKKPENMTCKHVSFCSSCKQNIREFQVQYKKKKRKLRMNLKCPDSNLVNVQMFLRDMDVTERSIIEEMFEQLKTVYEVEVDMVREEEERKIKRSLANHSLLLQKRYEEMEESFKAREAELECNMQQKKKFLWGLARALREQHSNMADAMRTVQRESTRLTAKEESLKHQISEAEQMLKRKGDEMRDQISSELIILQGHLNSMRKEKEEIDRERTELDKLKDICTSNTKIASDNIKETELLHTNYDILKNELLDLKKCLISHKKIEKQYTDRGVMTENVKLHSNQMNNEQEFGKNAKSDDSLKTANQLVNNLKKRKNVNFNQGSLEESIPDRSRGRHFEWLMQENERLKAFADQQHRHIEELTRDRLLLRSQLGIGLTGTMCTRPRTAPPTIQPMGINPSGVGFESGCRKGGGEELSIFPSPTRPLVPGDELPFVGVLPDRRTDTRRHLIKQWRSLRRSLIAGEVASPKAGTSRQDNQEDTSIPWPVSPQTVISANVTLDYPKCDQESRISQQPDLAVELNKGRVKSPKSVLREAKQKLRKKGGKNCVKLPPEVTTREKSPNTTLREAKLRLRKLEIEAEAVERSYMDFRRRQSKETDNGFAVAENNVEILGDTTRKNDIHHRSSFQKEHKDETNRSVHDLYSKKIKELLSKDFGKYIRDYQSKQNVGESHSMSINYKLLKNKLIQNKCSNITQDFEVGRQNLNYLETPLTEFRKLYHNEKPRQINTERVILKSNSLNTQEVKEDKCKPTQPQTNIEEINTIKTHIENIEENISIVKEESKLNNSNEILKERLTDTLEPTSEQIPSLKEAFVPKIEPIIEKSLRNTTNLLKVEVENVTETNNLTITDRDGCTIVLESVIDTNVLKVSQNNIKIDSPMTVIISPEVITTSPREIRPEQDIDKIKRESPDRFDSSNAISDKLCKSDASTPKLSIEKDELEPIDVTKGSLSQKQDANLFRKDVLDDDYVEAIQNGSNVDEENINNEVNSLNGTEGDLKDYPDDFSADVDNYESRSELSNSPISLPKTSEEENFWD